MTIHMFKGRDRKTHAKQASLVLVLVLVLVLTPLPSPGSSPSGFDPTCGALETSQTALPCVTVMPGPKLERGEGGYGRLVALAEQHLGDKKELTKDNVNTTGDYYAQNVVEAHRNEYKAGADAANTMASLINEMLQNPGKASYDTKIGPVKGSDYNTEEFRVSFVNFLNHRVLNSLGNLWELLVKLSVNSIDKDERQVRGELPKFRASIGFFERNYPHERELQKAVGELEEAVDKLQREVVDPSILVR